MGIELDRIKIWEEECYGFVMWSVDSIVKTYKTLNRTGPITLLDLGANVGKVTDLLLQELDIKKAYLFEPAPVLYQYIKDKYLGNNKIEIHNCALSDKNTLTFPFDQTYLKNQLDPSYTESYINLGVSKMCCSPEADLITSIKLSYFLNNNPHIYGENVILKIDTENQDFYILKDLLTVLNKFKYPPLIEFEINFFGGTQLNREDCQVILDRLADSGCYQRINLKESMEKQRGDEILIPQK